MRTIHLKFAAGSSSVLQGLGKLKLALALLILCTSCTPSSQTAGVRRDPPPAAGNTEAKPDRLPRQDVSSLCARIHEIKILPFKDEPVDDPVYNGLMEGGEGSLPCLIERVTDTTRMKDPRQTPRYLDTTVGDVAYFIFVRITKVGFTELLPADVQEAYKDEGVDAYFNYVKMKEHRKSLQGKLREWYQRKFGKPA
jgi:hypothetical protein